VVALVGDGGLAMSVAELETSVREGARPTILVFDNARYGTIRDHQDRRGMAPVATDLGDVDWAAVARGFGADAIRVDSDEEFEPALRTALASRRTTVLHLVVDRRWVSVDRVDDTVPAETAVQGDGAPSAIEPTETEAQPEDAAAEPEASDEPEPEHEAPEDAEAGAEELDESPAEPEAPEDAGTEPRQDVAEPEEPAQPEEPADAGAEPEPEHEAPADAGTDAPEDAGTEPQPEPEAPENGVGARDADEALPDEVPSEA
jgi:hypothetical protein